MLPLFRIETLALLTFTALTMLPSASTEAADLNSSFFDCFSLLLQNPANDPIAISRRERLGRDWDALKTWSVHFKAADLDGPAAEELNAVRYNLSTTITKTNGYFIHSPEEEAKVAMENWRKAERQVREWVAAGVAPNPERLFKLNETIGRGLEFNGGAPGRIRTTEFPDWFAARPVKELSKDLRRIDNWYHEASRTGVHPIELATIYYGRLITAHPFADGNGRTCRLALDWVLQLHGFPPASFIKPYSHSVTVGSDSAGRAVFLSVLNALEAVTDAVANSLRILEKHRQPSK